MSVSRSARLEARVEPIVQPEPSPQEGGLLSRAEQAIARGAEFLFSVQREDLRWCAELESNPTITAEYVMLCQILGIGFEQRQAGLVRYLLGSQNADGSWSIARQFDGDVSTTAEVYLALRILGVDTDHDALRAAEQYIRRNGGLEKLRIFSRIFFACFGLFPWAAIPVIPPEFILVPPSAKVNVYSLSSWARTTMVPLFVVFHHRPIFALPNGRSEKNGWLDHLWLDPTNKHLPYSDSLTTLLAAHGFSWKTLFGAADSVLRLYDRRPVGVIRKRAVQKCTEWILERQESSGDWAGIFPPMLNGLIALHLQGYGLDSEPMKKGLEAIHNFSWEDHEGLRIQACVSPVWDTVLSTIALVDCEVDPRHPKLRGAIQWVADRQCRVDYGDWKVYRPNLVSGGWSFEYFNTWYPDIDDTAAVILAMLKQDPGCATGETMLRAVEWTLGMQNEDGGWGAFDVENDKLFLNDIPFSDMDSLCDPSSPDVTGRVLEAWGLLLQCVEKNGDFPPVLRERLAESGQRAVSYLRQSQEAQGSWFGRWGVNYIYGTSNVLCGLARFGVAADDPMVETALRWLKLVQSPTGGYGESLSSYADKRWMGRGEPTASQTGWAVMGLLSYLPPSDPTVLRAVQWLVDHQVPADGRAALEGGVPVPRAEGFSWDEQQFTGTGFPNHFYLRYHYYRHYFPMMALGRFVRATRIGGGA